MRTQVASASKIVDAPADVVYQTIADYRTMHRRILPPKYFLSLDVEKGGEGAGTIINFSMRLLGKTKSFRSLITEPQPGSVLLETDLASGTETRFEIRSLNDGQRTRVIISTQLKDLGMLEGFIARRMLQKVYREELDLLANLATECELDRSAVTDMAALSK